MGFRRTLLIPAGVMAFTITCLSGTTTAQIEEMKLLVTGLDGASGSTVGPGGALYVTEAWAGRISRVDPSTGEITTFASGLPQRFLPFGGAMDVAFIGSTAYVLVSLVDPQVGGQHKTGIYRVDGENHFTLIADIGAFSLQNPPSTPFDAPTGLQFALESFRGGFLVTDGNHNRVLWVTRSGEIAEVLTFDNTVPTGLEVRGNTVYIAKAGPVPHRPEDGKVLSFAWGTSVTEVASGAPLLVDVEFGRGRMLYALSQGTFPVGDPPGSPALPNTGAITYVNGDGTLVTLVDGLDRPSSLEIIQNTAYVVTLGGEIWRIGPLSDPPFGQRQQ